VVSIFAPKYVPVLNVLQDSWDQSGVVIGLVLTIYGRLKPAIEPIVGLFTAKEK
jgi:hypothetical protein